MIYLAAGWAFIIVMLLISVDDPAMRPAYAVSMILLLIMFGLRVWMHLKGETKHLAQLDVLLSIIFLAPGLLLLITTIQTVFFYAMTWSDLLKPMVLIYVGINLLVVLPFVIFSARSLLDGLKRARAEKE